MTGNVRTAKFSIYFVSNFLIFYISFFFSPFFLLSFFLHSSVFLISIFISGLRPHERFMQNCSHITTHLPRDLLSQPRPRIRSYSHFLSHVRLIRLKLCTHLWVHSSHGRVPIILGLEPYAWQLASYSMYVLHTST